jgi:hypothetical protein
MKLGLKTIVLALVVALLCVPAAFAKGPGGQGHGKPSWAGGGGGNGHGKPAWAGHGKGHADKAKAKHEKKQKHQRAEAEDAAADADLNLDDLNPAWYCKTLEAMMDETDSEAAAGGAEAGEFSSFDAEFGENDNKRNSFGKCVSARAHGEDLSGALDSQENQEQSCEEPADDGVEDPAAEDGSEDPVADDGTGDSTVEDGTDDSTVEDGTEDTTVEDGTEEPVADDPVDDGSDDQAGEAEECESNDSAGEDDSAGEGDQGEETEVAAFARALVRFIKL